MRWTNEQYREYLKRRNQAGTVGICSAKPERDEGGALESVTPGKDTSSSSTQKRYRITFTVYSQTPNDYDNINIKQLQDCLVLAKLIPDDNWQILSGVVISEKAHSKAQERTEITIEFAP